MALPLFGVLFRGFAAAGDKHKKGPLRIQWNKRDLRRAGRVLDDAFKQIGDERPYAQSAVYLDKWVQENFRSQGGKVGSWAPFKKGGRYRKGFGIEPSAKLLQDTGRLRVSFIPFHSKREAGIGSDLPYAKYHDQGTKRLPKRRLLPERAEVLGDLLRIFQTHVSKIVKKANRRGG